jgi:sulfite exporter TauE/SafE/copper chaperone CopZ
MSFVKEIDVLGMHCKSCEKMIADELKTLDGVQSVRVSLKKSQATITSSCELDVDDIVLAIERAGYRVGNENRPLVSKNPKDWKIAFVGVIVAVVLILIFTKLGLDPSKFLSDDENNVSVVAVVMGLTAGFSTCIALIGGLVAGVSARHQKTHPNASALQNFQPHIAFNLGRIAGFAMLGGLMGLLGSALTFNPLTLGILTILAGVLMLLIGIQLTGLFPRLTTFTLPPKLAEKLGLNKHQNSDYHPLRTALIGALTFFLPCGFTQAMQLFAVTTGSWQTGALAMGLFALGTTPGLLLVGGLASLIHGKSAKTILKIVGVLVAALALVSVANGFNLTGLRLPDFSAKTSLSPSDTSTQLGVTFLGGSSFDTNEIKVKKGQKYVLLIKAEANGSGCMSAIMLPPLSNARAQLLRKGQTVKIEFEASRTGTYQPLCAMGVPFDLKIIVEEAA